MMLLLDKSIWLNARIFQYYSHIANKIDSDNSVPSPSSLVVVYYSIY